MSKRPDLSADRLGAAVLLAALFPVFGFAYMGMVGLVPEHVLNSDLVQPFMIMHDVVRDPALILSWTLSPAIYVFPDYLIAFVLNTLGIGPAHSMIVNGAILGVLLNLVSGYLLHAAGICTLTRGIVVATLAFFASILVGLILPGPIDTIMQTWTITTFIHSGALLGGIGLIGLWTAAELSGRKRPGLYAGALALAALCAYSDLTFLVYFVVPLAIATGIAWLGRPDMGRFLRTNAMILVAVAAYLTDRLLRGHQGKGGDFDIGQNILDWWTIVGPELPEKPAIGPLLWPCAGHAGARPCSSARADCAAANCLRQTSSKSPLPASRAPPFSRRSCSHVCRAVEPQIFTADQPRPGPVVPGACPPLAFGALAAPSPAPDWCRHLGRRHVHRISRGRAAMPSSRKTRLPRPA